MASMPKKSKQSQLETISSAGAVEVIGTGSGSKPEAAGKSTSTVTGGSNEDEIQSIVEVARKGPPPMVPMSRLGGKFRAHLQQLKTTACPGAFSQDNWYNSPKDCVNPVSHLDMTIAWEETNRLCDKYYPLETVSTGVQFSYFYFLMTQILSAKMEFLDNFDVAEIAKTATKQRSYAEKVAKAKQWMEFYLKICTDVFNLYTKKKYQKNLVPNQSQQQQGNNGAGSSNSSATT